MSTDIFYYPLDMPESFKDAKFMAYAPKTSKGPVIYLTTNYELMKVNVEHHTYEIFSFDMMITAIRYISPEKCSDFLQRAMTKMGYSLQQEGCLIINVGICADVLLFKPDISKMVNLYYESRIPAPHTIFLVEDDLYLTYRGWYKFNLRTGIMTTDHRSRYDIITITDKMILTKRCRRIYFHDLTMKEIPELKYNICNYITFIYESSKDRLMLDILPDNNLVQIDEQLNVKKLNILVSEFSKFICAGNGVVATYIPAIKWKDAFLIIYTNIVDA